MKASFKQLIWGLGLNFFLKNKQNFFNYFFLKAILKKRLISWEIKTIPSDQFS